MATEPSVTTEPPPQSDIRVVIVGAGIGGLTAAIECTRKGHSAIVLESFKNLSSQLGDVIGLHSNAGRVFRRWPGVHEKLEPICDKSKFITYKTWDGEEVLQQWWDDEDRIYGKKYTGRRGEIHKVIFDYAMSQGIEIRLGQKVTEYFENDNEAGVVSNGDRIVGDVVLGADGVRSEARGLGLGLKDKPKATGYAIYRAWMGSDELAKNPLTKDLVNNGDRHIGWYGPNIHFVTASFKNATEFCWNCTHEDTRDVDEGWSEQANHEDACTVLEGWDPAVTAIVRMTPPEKLIDWKLVTRDLLPTWVSAKGRIALLGDAAHPLLPTSAQGGSQAVEDGVCVAVCLQLSGRAHVKDALKAYEKIRSERVAKIQKKGMESECYSCGSCSLQKY